MKRIFKTNRYKLALALTATTVSAYAQIGKTSIKDNVKLKDEIKTIVYELPYMQGKTVFIVQGYNGWWSHKGQNSLDFWMRKNEIICAARDGIVQSTRSNSNKGGPSEKYINDGNYVIIKHNDSTCAAYWHLAHKGVLVNSGDTVKAGQPIGKVGTTGYSSGPHLHFEVYYYDKKGTYHTVKTVFNSSFGIKMPKAWRFYKKLKVKTKVVK